MNSQQIFALALGLKNPWFIEKIELSKPKEKFFGQLNIHLDFRSGSKFKNTSGKECGVYDTTVRSWQHLNFFEHECYLHARVPRIADPDTGKVETAQVPWARTGSGFTLLFEALAMLLIEHEMPVNKVAKTMRVVAHRIWRVFNYWLQEAVEKDDLSQLKQIGIDETSTKKGHNYVTIVADMDSKRTVFVTEGKDSETIKQFSEALESKGGCKEKIETVCMDMSPAFISGAVEHIPEAQIVFDKFHQVQMVNKALDETRKAERKDNDMLKGHKYTLLYSYARLEEKKKEQLHELLFMFPKLGEAYRLRELFNEMWEIKDKEEAKGYLAFWCDYAVDSKIIPFRKLVNTFKAHWSGIAAYFDKRITNGILEGINNKIQLAKRRARGYRNIKNFINMIYFLTGKLKFSYPQYPS